MKKELKNATEIKTYGDLVDYFDPSMVLNNEIMRVHFEDFELESGQDYNEEEGYYYDIFQYFIIDPYFAKILEDICPEEIVYYSDELDMFIWGVTHVGMSWDMVPIKTIYN